MDQKQVAGWATGGVKGTRYTRGRGTCSLQHICSLSQTLVGLYRAKESEARPGGRAEQLPEVTWGSLVFVPLPHSHLLASWVFFF